MQVAVVNLGCKVNRVESDRISMDLERFGHELVDQEHAHAVVINTCAVTTEAEKKTRKAVRHAANLPLAPTVVVCGCAVNLNPETYEALGPDVHAVSDKSVVASYIDKLSGGTGVYEQTDENVTFTSAAAEELSHRRLGIKVQDGCDNRCSYCIIWKARGKPTSIPVALVLQSVREAVSQGVQEVVLTGINLGSYEDVDAEGERTDLVGLLKKMLDETDIARIRLSSVEPPDATDELLTLMASHRDRVCSHLHLALQSGCEKTLKEMHRVYTADEFRRIVARARQIMPDICLSTDLIVGFPGETEEDFEESLAFCEEMKFAKIHTFRYSPRPGTPAAARKDQVAPQDSAERSRRIRELQDRMRYEDALSRVGDEEYVLLEKLREGTSGSYHRVVVTGLNETEIAPGDLVKVRFATVAPDAVITATFLEKR